MTAPRRLALAALALLGAGWETTVQDPEPPHPYINAYQGVDEDRLDHIWVGMEGFHLADFTGNEHRELAAIALAQLGWTGLFADAPAPMIDLNASVWRPEARVILTGDPGDSLATPLVERRWPGISRLAGLPDYAYSFSDWINASTLCAALPPDAAGRDRCHVYAVWHGATLNSSHFGAQATAAYRHYHAIALALADNAHALADAAAGAADRDELHGFVQAAEREALAYEAVAQHYLQDRWSVGHAWNRWNGPRYADQAHAGPAGLDDSISTGLIAGFEHGAEAALELLPLPQSTFAADPMCSPVIAGGAATPMTAMHDGRRLPMIGDDRLRDAIDGHFGAEYGQPDFPIDVHEQLTDLLRCSKAGWADVARRFAAGPTGSAGLGLVVRAGAPTFDDAELSTASDASGRAPCWDVWATNDAMVTGIQSLGQGSFGGLLKGATYLRLVFAQRKVKLNWNALLRVAAAIRRAARAGDNGNATDLARGLTLPDLLNARPGQHYVASVPMDYSEPLAPPGTDERGPFSTLPLHAERDQPAVGDRPGRDKHTLYGFFHQAHADYWCKHARATLTYDRSRPLDDPEQGVRWPVPLPADAPTHADELARRLDACVLLADRTFAATDQTGARAEHRKVGHGGDGASDAAPPCEVIGAAPAAWDDDPAHPHPGYVSAADGPYATAPFYGATVYASTVAWCQALPVIDVDADDFVVDAAGARQVITPGFDAAGTMTFAPERLDPLVTIHGHNFGPRAGKLKLTSAHDCVDPLMVSPYPTIVSWTDTTITFQLDETRFPPDVWSIEVIRDDKTPQSQAVRSIGRFQLDVARAAYTGLRTPGGPFPPAVNAQSFLSVHPFCAGGRVLHHAFTDCTDLSGAALTACGAPGGGGTPVWTGPAPMTAFAPGPYPDHRYIVAATGTCPQLVTPGLPCPPSGVRLQYGAVHALQRTSTNPIPPQPARSWRATLAWQRAGLP